MNEIKKIVFFMVLLAINSVCICSYGQELEKTQCANRKYGFKNKKTGAMVVPCKYDKIDDWFFVEGIRLARVRIKGKWGFIDEAGMEVIPLIYFAAGNFSEGLARVQLKNKWGFVDKTGAFYKNEVEAAAQRRNIIEERERVEKEGFFQKLRRTKNKRMAGERRI